MKKPDDVSHGPNSGMLGINIELILEVRFSRRSYLQPLACKPLNIAQLIGCRNFTDGMKKVR
jgi:hypothetical protein